MKTATFPLLSFFTVSIVSLSVEYIQRRASEFYKHLGNAKRIRTVLSIINIYINSKKSAKSIYIINF